MVERNMIREGFIRNTPTSPTNPTFSGSQVVNEIQQFALADTNLSVAAVTVSATENINLTADLGARWKLHRIELYTDDPSANNITMEISDNNVEYYEVTMTGSPNLYVGDIPDSTISGTPRYIRYRHAAASALDVFEWRAMSDDTLVDFGDTGNQTEVEIEDAPIGKPSDVVTELKLFNRHSKAGTAFVFIDNTDSSVDKLIEVAVTNIGPWFGSALVDSVQPDNTSFSSGTLDNTRVVTASGYFADFVNDQLNLRGWVGDNGTSVNFVFNGLQLSSNNSLNPRLSNFGSYTGITDSNTGGDLDQAGIGNYTVHRDTVTIRSDWYDRVRVRLVGASIDSNNFVEGPRLYWKGIDDPDSSSWDINSSTLSQFPFNTFTGGVQDFIFEVGEIPTWSGAQLIRGLSIQPFTTSTGINVDTTLQEVEIFHSSHRDRVLLDLAPTISGAGGLRQHLFAASLIDDDDLILSMLTRVTQPCIITKVIFVGIIFFTSVYGLFLSRFDEENSGFTFPAGIGSNFVVKNVVRPPADGTASNITNTTQIYVRWKAAPGDFIGIMLGQGGGNQITYRNTALAGSLSAWKNDAGTTPSSLLNSAAAMQSGLNTRSEAWVSVDNRWYQIWFEAISAGDYVSQGTYATPIFDGGTLPSLLSSSFISFEPSGSSVDSKSVSAFKTVRVRASDSPPLSAPALGEAIVGLNPFDPNNPPPWWQFENTIQDPDLRISMPILLNELGPGVQNDFQLNFINGSVTSRENATGGIQNVGATMMYHPLNDELWIMNVLLSGTHPIDLRPIWDVYSPDDFSYIRTQHLTGQISYAYDFNSTFQETFFPSGFVYDEERQEIYIINRLNNFFINTATYYALVMNPQGEFIRLSYRGGAFGGNTNFPKQTIGVAFDGTYFYHLTDTLISSPSNSNNLSRGSHIAIYRRGNVSNPNAIDFIGSIDITNVAGFEDVNLNPRGQQIIYNPETDLIYLMYANPINSSDAINFRVHELHALRITFNTDGSAIETVAKVNIEGIAKDVTTGGIRIRSLDVPRDGFVSNPGEPEHNIINFRQLAHGTGWVYIPNRDMYAYLQTRGALWDVRYNIRINQRVPGTNLYRGKSLSFMLGFGAGTKKEFGTSPTFARSSDAIWGATSGTLQYEIKEPNSVLFPPGRYGQVQYTLNASPDLKASPQLISSQFDQGLRIGNIPASGTTSIFLRTNLPEDEMIGDQQGKLKLVWELPE